MNVKLKKVKTRFAIDWREIGEVDQLQLQLLISLERVADVQTWSLQTKFLG